MTRRQRAELDTRGTIASLGEQPQRGVACFASMPPDLELHAFRFLDPVSGRWVRARYRATRAEIAARYAVHVLEGEPERRPRDAPGFNPFARAAPVARPAALGDVEPSAPASLDAREAELLGYFLRRYITYCARRGRFAAMNGAVRLLRKTCPATG